MFRTFLKDKTRLATDLPALGNESKHYPVELTEPEINAIHAAYGFLSSACYAPVPEIREWWKHYGPTLRRFSERLGEFDD